jgi:hypothetical protein
MVLRILAGVAVCALLPAVASAADGPPLPAPAAADGTLPRSYAGWTLGQPAPETERTSTNALFPEAVVHIEMLSETPRVFRKAFVHDGTVFRIEWLTRQPDLDRDAVVSDFSARLGAPIDSPYAVRDGAEWSDGIGAGRTTIMVRRAKNSEWLTVAVQDTGRAVDLWRP